MTPTLNSKFYARSGGLSFYKAINKECEISNWIVKNIVKFMKYLGVNSFYYVTDDEIRCACPLHNGSSPTSFAIYLKTGTFCCYSHDCHKTTGNRVIDLFHRLGVSFDQLKQDLLSIPDAVEYDYSTINSNTNNTRKKSGKIQSFSLQYLKAYTQYQVIRGIPEVPIFSYILDNNFVYPLERRAIFPAWDIGHRSILGMTGRTLINAEPKWKHIVRAGESNIVYFPHTLKYDIHSVCFICESPIDAIKVELATNRPAIACLKSNLSPRQADRIVHLSNKFIILQHNDPDIMDTSGHIKNPGRDGAKKSLKTLTEYGRKCQIFSVPAKDPGELSIERLKNVLYKFLTN